MNVKRSLITTALVSALISGMAQAAPDRDRERDRQHSSDDRMEMKGMSSDQSGNYMQERQRMMEDMMGMMKETMTIVRNLNHQPSAEEKRRLDDMITRMDEIMKKHKEWHEKMQNMHNMNGMGGMGMMGGHGGSQDSDKSGDDDHKHDDKDKR